MDFIYGFHLSSSYSSKAVTMQKCYKNWLVSTWKKLSLKESFKPANRNVCFETVRRPLHEPDMKIDQYETEKSHIAFWSSLSECLHVQKWYEIHDRVEFVSFFFEQSEISTPDMSCSAHICSTGLRMNTWKMLIVSLKISFADCSKVFLIVL